MNRLRRYVRSWGTFLASLVRTRPEAQIRPRLPDRVLVPGHFADIEITALDLFEKTYTDFQALVDRNARLHACKEQLVHQQSSLDYRKLSNLHMTNENRIDTTQENFDHPNLIAALAEEKRVIKSQLETLQREVAELERSQDEDWKQFYPRSSQYFNNCLSANFEADWSLAERDCRFLRTILDRIHLKADQQTEIRELMGRRRNVRLDLYRAEKTLKDAGPASVGFLSIRLGMSRKERLESQLKEIETELQVQEEIQRLRHKRIEEMFRQLYEPVIRPLLERSGRIQPLGLDANPGDEEGGIKSPQQAYSEDQPDLEGSNANASVNTDTGLDQIADEYMDLLNELIRLRYDRDGRESFLRSLESDHMATFTESNHQKFDAFVARQIQSMEEAIELTEEDLSALRQRLVDAGRPIPRSPDRALRSVRGGGITKSPHSNESGTSPSVSSSIAYRRRRKNITNWRLDTGHARASDPPSAERSHLASERLSPPSSRSGSMELEEEQKKRMKKRREEHNRHRNELRKGRGVSPA